MYNPRRAKAGLVAGAIACTSWAATASIAHAQDVDPCVGWQVVELVTGLGMVENLEPDGRGGLLFSSTDRGRIERLATDGTVTVAFDDVPGPGGLRVRDGVLYANTGDTLASGATGATDGTIQAIDLTTGARTTWASGLTMPNGLVFAADGRAFTSRDIGANAAVTVVPADPPRTPSRFAEISDSNGLAIDAAEEWLYVSTTFDPLAPVHRVRLDDPSTIELVANLTSVGIPIVKGLDDLTIDGDDVLYLTANGSGEILRLDPATGAACVIAGGLGNPTAIKLGAGPGWAADHLFVSAWDGVIRELVPPVGAAPTPLTPDEPEPDPEPEPDADAEPAPPPATSLPATGGGVGLAALAMAAVPWLRRRPTVRHAGE